MKKGQSEVIGFILLTLIVITAVSISFFWAKPQIDKINNVNEISRIENRMLALHHAVKDTANERGQRTVSFEIKEGQLYLDDNKRKIVYSAYLKLPEEFISNRKILAGNSSTNGPCVNTSIFGRLGLDDSGCITEKGSIEIELEYLNVNDTSGKCYGIWLDAGENVMAGSGSHNILLTFKETNTTAIAASCTESKRQVVTVDMG